LENPLDILDLARTAHGVTPADWLIAAQRIGPEACQPGHLPFQPLVLTLQILHPPRLALLQAAILFAPSIVRLFAVPPSRQAAGVVFLFASPPFDLPQQLTICSFPGTKSAGHSNCTALLSHLPASRALDSPSILVTNMDRQSLF